MLKVDFSQAGSELNIDSLKSVLEEIATQPATAFETTDPQLNSLVAACQPFLKYSNVILIGNGGSRNNAWSFYHALAAYRNQTHFEFLSSIEPDLVLSLKQKFTPKNTLILAISKSGNNINMLEPLLSFLEYPVLVISENKPNPLTQIAEMMSWTVIHHPNVSGRFSGFTSCALVPAILMGLDPQVIYQGAKEAFEQYSTNQLINSNDALKLAAWYFQLEQQGISEIFASIYSTPLSQLLPLFVQLIHESSGQKGKGQSIFGDYSPESQHHTNQRLFGGPKNMLATFIIPQQPQKDFSITVPDSIQQIMMDNQPLTVLNGNSAFNSLRHDYQGVLEHCTEKSIPAFTISPEEITPKTVGELIAFFYYVAYYSALLRSQDPFDQPEVERAKKISFALRAAEKK